MDNSKLCDAHCHPHDDIEHLDMIPKLKTGHITIMGVRQDDWDRVAQITSQCTPGRCIPASGKMTLVHEKKERNQSICNT